MEVASDAGEALSAVAEAMNFVLSDAGVHITKGNMKKELPLSKAAWQRYRKAWKGVPTDKEGMWYIVGQLIVLRDKRQKARMDGDIDEENRVHRQVLDYSGNLVNEYLMSGVREHRN